MENTDSLYSEYQKYQQQLKEAILSSCAGAEGLKRSFEAVSEERHSLASSLQRACESKDAPNAEIIINKRLEALERILKQHTEDWKKAPEDSEQKAVCAKKMIIAASRLKELHNIKKLL